MDAGSSVKATLNKGSDAALRSLKVLGSNLSVNKPLSISTILGSIEAKVSSMLIPQHIILQLVIHFSVYHEVDLLAE